MFTTSVMWIHRFAHACMQAGSFFTQTHTLTRCVNLTQWEVFPYRFSFLKWREVMPQREMGTWHTPAGGKWRLIKSPGFLGRFLGRAGNLNAHEGAHHHGSLGKHEHSPFFFIISALTGTGFIHSQLNHRGGHNKHNVDDFIIEANKSGYKKKEKIKRSRFICQSGTQCHDKSHCVWCLLVLLWEWHQQSTSSSFHSPACDCIAAGPVASFQTLTFWIVSTTADALLSPLPPPLSIFDQFLSIFLSFSQSPAQSPFLAVRGMIDSCELSHNCIIISQPCTFWLLSL